MDTSGDHRIILITGVSAAGKSSVAQALTERLPTAVHLRGDIFRKMIVTGRVESEGRDLDPAFLEQLRLRYAIACDAAGRYAAAGFQVVYQDVILGPLLQEVVERLQPLGLAVIVLDPSVEAIARREAARGKTGYRGVWTPEAMAAVLRETTPRIGLWIDTSAMDVAETVETILGGLRAALV